MDVLLLALLIAADQITKKLAVIRLKDQPSFVLIDGILELSYLENKGAAFRKYGGSPASWLCGGFHLFFSD